MGDGISVPVEETEEADEPSSSRIASGLAIVSNTGASVGNLANLDLANDFCNSLMGVRAEVGDGVFRGGAIGNGKSTATGDRRLIRQCFSPCFGLRGLVKLYERNLSTLMSEDYIYQKIVQ